MSEQPHWKTLEAPYVSGDGQAQGGLPLDRYLPPYMPGQAAKWLNVYAPPGSWVLDPFGQDPFGALELAAAGYRVLVTANNPVAAFMMEVLAENPPAEEFNEALGMLGDLRTREGARLEDFVNCFYRFDCPSEACVRDRLAGKERQFEAVRFTWREGEAQPYQASGACPHCGLAGEVELTAELLAGMAELPNYSLHRARALELAASPDDPLRPVMEEVTRYYSERALVVLQILLNRLENPVFSARQKRLLQALFLSAADQANQLWARPLGRNRPRQLTRPPVYDEVNVWQALKSAVSQWTRLDREVTLRYWPEVPPQKGGISLFRGRLRELSPKPDPRMAGAVYSSLPRRNQAWWNLSGLWSGWLWGREGVRVLRGSLLKQRYDWTWHAVALEKVLAQLKGLVWGPVPVLLQVGELDPLFLIAAVKAAQEAGLSLRTAALEGSVSSLQTVWKLEAQAGQAVSAQWVVNAAAATAKEFLAARGEPASYLRLFSHVILSLQNQGMLFHEPAWTPETPLNQLESALEPVFLEARNFKRYNPGVGADTGRYWLAEAPARYASISDRLEQALAAELHTQPALKAAEAQKVVNECAPGMMTPDPGTVEAILSAYADQVRVGGQTAWRLREREALPARARDLEEMWAMIEQIARMLKFRREICPGNITFIDEDGKPAYTFFAMVGAEMTEVLLQHQETPGQKLIVIPGSRSNLVGYKLRNDPSLRELVGADWDFVKFRQLRNIARNPLLTRELFAAQLLGDQPEYRAGQLALF